LDYGGEIKTATKAKVDKKAKLVTVVTPIGYLTTTPEIAKRIIASQKKKMAKK
jgi:hypothetical protein